MPYYHLRIVYQVPEQQYPTTDYELDLSEEDTKLFAEQYEKGRLFFKGKWIEVSNIKEVEIRETFNSSVGYYPNPLSASTIFYGTRTDIKNVTRKFIKSPPKVEGSEKQEKITRPISRNIFIVHGRDHEPMKELKAMLYEFGLNPIVLHEQPSGSRTIMEKLEKYSNVGYAFIVLTPDDLGIYQYEIPWEDIDSLRNYIKAPRKDLVKPPKYLESRARQNVVLEFGYFMGLLGRDRVCCLHKGNVALPSDMHGIVYIPFEDSIEEVRLKIMKELKEAGYEIKL